MTQGEQVLRILLVDHQTLFRAGLKHLLSPLGKSLDVHEAECLDGALDCLAPTLHFDLVLIDIQCHGVHGVNDLTRVIEAAPSVPVVAMSGEDHPDAISRTIEAGARGFLLKTCSPEVLICALQLVLSGGVYLPPNILSPPTVPRRTNNSGKSGLNETDSAEWILTPRQMDVLNCLAKGLSNKETAECLGLMTGTVKIHVSGILRALKVNNRTQAVIAVERQRGIPAWPGAMTTLSR